MTPPSPSTAAPEQRLLAAIVFTDVVSFSARVQSEESATLKLVERDFAVMRALGTKLSGKVIKSTGDGLLVFFTSAVQAMEWSLQIQRQFAAQARTLPPGEFLRHRVGVHVGDVFLTADDVMGDGVNIAARVQTEAPAGGICISQSVYDLVKNKIKLDVVRLEPRKLKNISEFIQMYHVLLEPRAVVVAPPAPVPAHARGVTQEEASPRRPKFAIVAVLLAIAGITAWLGRAYFEHEKDLSQSHAAQAKLGDLLPDKAARALPAAQKNPAAAVRPAGTDELKFAERALARPTAGANAEDELLRREASDSIPPAVAWAGRQLSRYNAGRPLLARPLESSAQQTLTVFTRSDGQLYSASAAGGAERKREWADFRPDQQGAILLALLHDAAPPPGPEVIRGAGAFAYFHRLPDMARRLIDERRTDSPAR